jgi:hypothetical protein
MTTPPLPDTPCVRCRLGYTNQTTLKAGSRFYIAYAGSAPDSSHCGSLATQIAASWLSNIAPLVNPNFVLTEVDVIDIASVSGSSGQWIGSNAGTRAGTPESAQECMNVEFGIADRYRGGKPRMFFPPGVNGDRSSDALWTTGYVSAWTTGVTAFFGGITGFSLSPVSPFTHIILSYYHGFTNVTNTSGRMRAAPTYRSPNAIHHGVTGYFPKQEIGSQRKRRESTTY